MSSRFYYIAAAVAGVLAVIAIIAAVTTGSLSSRMNDNFTATSSTTYQCTGTPQETAADIEDRVGNAQARATDPANGTEYLRYNRNLISVSGAGAEDCTIRVEDLGRVNNGAFIFLGPGFAPPAPSGSSGGSSGSGSGVK